MDRLRPRSSLAVSVALAAACALALAAPAAADKEKIHLTRAGNAAAKATMIRRADLGSSTAWTGGARKPSLNTSVPCATYHPKQSDLVVVGAARTVWKAAGLQFDSQAEVLETASMVSRDWSRTVVAPQMLPCLRAGLAKSLGSSGKLVSFRKIAFPRLARYTRAYRALVDVAAATGTVRAMVDIVLVGRGRTELTLSTTAQYAAASVVKPAEVRLATVLAARIRA